MLSDPNFRESLWTFIVFAAFIAPTTFALSLATAVLVARTTVAQTFFRSVFFLPTACSYVVAALIWKMSIFSGVRFGLANYVLGWFGIDSIPWLSVTNPPWYWLVIVSARLWLQVGFYMILFLAGLQRISPTLYEAAAIDGVADGLPLHHVPDAAADVGGGVVAAAHQRLPGVRRVLQHPLQLRHLPAVRPATPGSTPYYTALGQGQDFGHGSAGAIILTAMIALVVILFGFASFEGMTDHGDRQQDSWVARLRAGCAMPCSSSRRSSSSSRSICSSAMRS